MFNFSGCMDHVTYEGVLQNETRNCVAFMDHDGLHLTPVGSTAFMQVQFSHLDKMDSSTKERKFKFLFLI